MRFLSRPRRWYHRIYPGNGVYTLPPTMADQVWALSFSFITKRLLDQEILFINLHHCSLSVCDSSDWFAKELIKPTFPAELKGTSTLDVGSNAGFFSILAIMRGAGRILGIESFKMFLMRLNISEISGRWISNTVL